MNEIEGCLVKKTSPAFPDYPIIRFERQGGFAEFGFDLNGIDSFAVCWLVSPELTLDDLLKQASVLVDSLAGNKFAPRPMETADAIGTTSLPVNDTKEGSVSGTMQVAGSYSGFNYNNLLIGFMREITFDEVGWPLTRQKLMGAYRQIGKTVHGKPFTDEMINDYSFVRINAEFCTIMINGESNGDYRDFVYWSHIPAIPQLMEAFRATSRVPHLAGKFGDITNILTSPIFAQYLEYV